MSMMNNGVLTIVAGISILAGSILLPELAAESGNNYRDPSALPQKGDYKRGYESSDYVSQARSIQNRKGEATDLLHLVNNPPLGLPPVPVPEDNPITKEKIELGRKLFYDRRLSLTDTQSCGICHIPEQGFSSNELETAVGIEGRTVKRNSPTIYNVAYQKRLFHDAREFTLEQQIWAPLLADNEMDNPSIGWVIEKIRHMPDYEGMFEKAFEEGLTFDTVGKAIASYNRSLISANSPFDRWYFGDEEGAVDDAVKRGFKLFTGKGKCSSCHLIEEDYALFTDHQLHNTGIGYLESTQPDPPKQKVQLAPGVFVDVDTDIIKSVSRPKPNDVGRYEVTQNPDDRWKYKTPSLRNVEVTYPYMHNGKLHTLRDVIEFYIQGGIENPLQDPLIQPVDLDEQDTDDLVAFLKSLTGDNVRELVLDGIAAPIGDIKPVDPNWAHENKHDY